jgi:hypothetical protein
VHLPAQLVQHAEVAKKAHDLDVFARLIDLDGTLTIAMNKPMALGDYRAVAFVRGKSHRPAQPVEWVQTSFDPERLRRLAEQEGLDPEHPGVGSVHPALQGGSFTLSRWSIAGSIPHGATETLDGRRRSDETR